MSDLVIKSPIFDSSAAPDRGFTIRAFYLEEPHAGDALVEIFRDGNPYRRMLYPAYKVYNLAAHWSEIVDGEIDGDFAGYDAAGWAGFGAVVYPTPLPSDVRR